VTIKQDLVETIFRKLQELHPRDARDQVAQVIEALKIAGYAVVPQGLLDSIGHIARQLG
jgi:hypothetical protein